VRVGIDLVSVPRIAESIATFGERFLRRVFTPGELAYAAGSAEKLAARFAAKEAVKKALRLDGVGWTEIEVVRGDDGAPHAVFGGREVAISMSHEGDYATAIAMIGSE
jgi:holo-[acyl-carrier protein] synthase